MTKDFTLNKDLTLNLNVTSAIIVFFGKRALYDHIQNIHKKYTLFAQNISYKQIFQIT